MAKISIALLTHNEHREFEWLASQLSRYRDCFDEIVVVDDRSDQAFQDLLDRTGRALPIALYRRSLGKSFAAQRNFLFERCTGDVLFWLDPDELPAPLLLRSLRGLSEYLIAQRLDAARILRLNVCRDEEFESAPAELFAQVSPETAKPEWQPRIVRKQAHVKWTSRVHEQLIGIERGARLPDGPEYALLHCKTHRRQEAQNRFYHSFHLRYLDKLEKSIGKRLRPPRNPLWRALDEAEMSRIREMGGQSQDARTRCSGSIIASR